MGHKQSKIREGAPNKDTGSNEPHISNSAGASDTSPLVNDAASWTTTDSGPVPDGEFDLAPSDPHPPKLLSTTPAEASKAILSTTTPEHAIIPVSFTTQTQSTSDNDNAIKSSPAAHTPISPIGQSPKSDTCKGHEIVVSGTESQQLTEGEQLQPQREVEHLRAQIFQLRNEPYEDLEDLTYKAWLLGECNFPKCAAAMVMLASEMHLVIRARAEYDRTKPLVRTLETLYEKCQNDLNESLEKNIQTNNLSIEYLEQRNQYSDELKTLREQINDPRTTQFLKYKVKRLEQESLEIARLRSQNQRAATEHNELVQLRALNARLQEEADLVEQVSRNHSQLQIAYNNMKMELISLKKRNTVAETLEVKEKLHQANTRNEELQQQLKVATDRANIESTSSDVDTDNPILVNSPELTISTMNLPQFTLHGPSLPTEAIRALSHMNRLTGTVVKRAQKISGERAGMGWDSFSRLEQLVGVVAREGREVRKAIGGMEGAKEAEARGSGPGVLRIVREAGSGS